VVRYDNRFFQLEAQSRHYAPERGKVWLCEGRHGNLAMQYGGHALRWRQIAAPGQPLHAPPGKASPGVPISVKKRKWTPSANHPWHEPAGPEVQKRAAKMAAGPARPSLAWPSASP
jgi:hypothetical protein